MNKNDFQKPASEKNLTVFSVSLPPSMVEDVDRIAAINSVSRSAVLRWAIMDYLTKEALSNA